MLSRSAQRAYNKGYFIFDHAVIGPTGRPRKVKYKPHLEPKQQYPTFNIKENGKTITVFCHQLAAWQKFGYDCIGKEIQIRHLDSDVTNFSLDNIELGTKTENMQDRIRKNWEEKNIVPMRFVGMRETPDKLVPYYRKAN